jgi:hypothetical protein
MQGFFILETAAGRGLTLQVGVAEVTKANIHAASLKVDVVNCGF